MTEAQVAPEGQKTYWGTTHQNKKVRKALRQMYADAWVKAQGAEVLSPLEAQIVQVIEDHPEYQPNGPQFYIRESSACLILFNLECIQPTVV